jgi:hypothetical protein
MKINKFFISFLFIFILLTTGINALYYDYNFLYYTTNSDLSYSLVNKFNDTFNYNDTYLTHTGDYGDFIWNKVSFTGNFLNPQIIQCVNLSKNDEYVNISGFGFNVNYTDQILNGNGYLQGTPWANGIVGGGWYLISWNSVARTQYCKEGGSVGGVGYGQQESGSVTFEGVTIKSYCSGNISAVWKDTNISTCMTNARNLESEASAIKSYVVGNFTEYALYIDMNYYVYSLFVNGNCGDCCFIPLQSMTLINITSPKLAVVRYNSGGTADNGYKIITNFKIERINEIEGLIHSNLTSNENAMPDIAQGLEKGLDNFGLISSASRMLIGIIIILFINFMIVGYFLKTGGIGTGHYYIMLLLNVILIIAFTIFKLFPIWILIVMVLIGLGLGGLLISQKMSGAG